MSDELNVEKVSKKNRKAPIFANLKFFAVTHATKGFSFVIPH